jgi:hypothetical protein
MRRAIIVGNGSATAASTYAFCSMKGEAKIIGTLLDARTASPVSPRVNATSVRLARSVATTASGVWSDSIGRPRTARLTNSCRRTPENTPPLNGLKSSTSSRSSARAICSSASIPRPAQ